MRDKTEEAVYPCPDYRVLGAVYIVFIVCVLSSAGLALGEFLLYGLVLFAAVRLFPVSLQIVMRRSMVLVPAVLALAIAIIILKHGWITRLAAFWNIAAKVFLVTVGTSLIVSIFHVIKKVNTRHSAIVRKEDLRFLFVSAILIIEIRMWGG